MSTSCEQKINGDGHTSRSGVDVDIDTVSDSLANASISDDDDKLFADPPPKKECPICMLPIPYSFGACGVQTIYMACCGKTVCFGCMLAAAEEVVKGNIKKWCPFCRMPMDFTDKEMTKRVKKRLKLNDADATMN